MIGILRFLKIRQEEIYEFDYLSDRFGGRYRRGIEFFRTALDFAAANLRPEEKTEARCFVEKGNS